MKKFLFVLLSLYITSSCNSAGTTSFYTLEGTITNVPNATIYLEKLNLQKATVIDTAKTDNAGKFKFSGTTEKGFYRIKVSDQMFWMLLMENKKYEVTLDPNNPLNSKYVGSPENDEFQAIAKQIAPLQAELGPLNQQYQQRVQQGLQDSTTMQLAILLQKKIADYETIVLEKRKNTKSAFVSIYCASMLNIQKYPKENLESIQRLEKEYSKSSYVPEMKVIYDKYDQEQKQAEMQQKQERTTGVGAIAPDLAYNNPDGKLMKLSDTRGKVVLLDFWASWCGPCRREMPNVVAAYTKYKDKGFTVFSVSLDKDAAAWKNAIIADGMVWDTHVSDLKAWQSAAAAAYGINSIPATYLLDKTGKIVAKDLRGPALDNALEQLLK